MSDPNSSSSVVKLNREFKADVIITLWSSVHEEHLELWTHPSLGLCWFLPDWELTCVRR